jgi:tetratricopeptide (TPR) repeat protein
LEEYEEQLAVVARLNELYRPELMAYQAWPLMKLGRYDAARRAARRGIESTDDREIAIGLNALCAIEFEAGEDGRSYQTCQEALDFGRQSINGPNVVDLTNYAEAARSLFRLDEAERVALEATQAQVSWYGNPWLELAELYTRQGRFAEALNALKSVGAYRNKRPPHVRDADRNEDRRALAAFFLSVGRAEDALRVTEKALVSPDRRAHNSRDPNQDRAIIALLDRRARLLLSESLLERASARPIHERLVPWLRVVKLEVEAWMSGRQVARLLADEDRLVGTFRIGTAKSAVTPPWLVGELVEVLGVAVVREGLRRARRKEKREGAEAYYQAFEAEAALADGELSEATTAAGRALAELGPSEALLRARVWAVAAEAARRSGDPVRAAASYELAMQSDPGVFRRMGWSLPVRMDAGQSALARRVGEALDRSPRLRSDDYGLGLRIDVDASGGAVCLLGPSGGVLGCGGGTVQGADGSEKTPVEAVVDGFHERAFAPRIDLSQAEANSLDGSNRVTRDPTEILTPGSSLGE